MRKGDLLGYISTGKDAVVRVVAEQQDANRIRQQVERIEVQLFDLANARQAGRLIEEIPAASDVLPSAALGSRAGGAALGARYFFTRTRGVPKLGQARLGTT